MNALLHLDYDAKQAVPSVGFATWLLARSRKRLVWWSQQRSPSGRGWHVTIKVRPACRTAMEVAALQAVMGSDPKREACNVNRARMVDTGQVPVWWRSRWNVLYG